MQLLFLPLRTVDKGFRTPKVVITIFGKTGSTNHEGAVISLPPSPAEGERISALFY